MKLELVSIRSTSRLQPWVVSKILYDAEKEFSNDFDIFDPVGEAHKFTAAEWQKRVDEITTERQKEFARHLLRTNPAIAKQYAAMILGAEWTPGSSATHKREAFVKELNDAGIFVRPEDSRDGLLIEMRGESGEVYHFGGTLEPGAKPEDMLTHIAGEIAATRRKKKRPTYKVKSLMPPGSKFHKRGAR
ncbi:MAG: hypothetical protein WCI95_03085 [bacterium]